MSQFPFITVVQGRYTPSYPKCLVSEGNHRVGFTSFTFWLLNLLVAAMSHGKFSSFDIPRLSMNCLGLRNETLEEETSLKFPLFLQTYKKTTDSNHRWQWPSHLEWCIYDILRGRRRDPQKQERSLKVSLDEHHFLLSSVQVLAVAWAGWMKLNRKWFARKLVLLLAGLSNK